MVSGNWALGYDEIHGPEPPTQVLTGSTESSEPGIKLEMGLDIGVSFQFLPQFNSPSHPKLKYSSFLDMTIDQTKNHSHPMIYGASLNWARLFATNQTYVQFAE